MKILVAIPLCDYEPITSGNWNRTITHYITKKCLQSFQESIFTPLDLYILADRCTDRFVYMAEKILARFNPRIMDNSRIGYGLANTSLPEKYQHVVNQFMKTIELAESYDLLYFCEQDYLFKENALGHALVAFEEIPQVNVLSMFDHPDRHNPAREPEYGRHKYYHTSLSTWKSVSSTNGNWLWRINFIKERYDWLVSEYKRGGLDFAISHGLYRQGELLLSPVKSLIQHFRLDGTNRSPTFGPCFSILVMTVVGRALRVGRRVQEGRLRRRL
jgi:hypothetical protein